MFSFCHVQFHTIVKIPLITKCHQNWKDVGANMLQLHLFELQVAQWIYQTCRRTLSTNLLLATIALSNEGIGRAIKSTKREQSCHSVNERVLRIQCTQMVKLPL